MSAEILLTRISRPNSALLSKRIYAGADGSPISDGGACAMAKGTATRVCLNGQAAANLAALIMALGSHEALVLGDLADGLPDRIEIVRDDVADPGQGTYGRTRQTFTYRPGQPAAVLLDFDRKGMPDAVRQRLDELGGFEAALALLIRGYTGLARVVRASTSSGITNTATGQLFPGSGGLHVYVFAKDGTDIPRFLQDLQKRAWLAGLGWIGVAGRGALLIRSIVDASVGYPERLSFEGAPLVEPPLVQDVVARSPVAHDGELLDTTAVCPPLSRDEQRRFDELVKAAKLAAKPQAEAAADKAAENIASKRGIGIEKARAVVQSSHSGVLSSHDVLDFDDAELGTVSVAEVLADPERFHERTLKDPMQGAEGDRGKARLYWNADGSVIVHSFAGGGTAYRLQHDLTYIEAQLAQAGERAPYVLAALMVHAKGLDVVERERLRKRAGSLGKVSQKTVKDTTTEAIGKARKKAREDGRQSEPDPETLPRPEPQPAAGGDRRATESAGDALLDTSHDGLALEMGGQWTDGRYVALFGKWLFFTGSRWERDERLLHMTRTREFLRAKANEIVRWAEARGDAELIKSCKAVAKKMRDATTVASVEKLARSNPEQSAGVDQWDADPLVLGTPGGTVDLRTGTLRAACQNNYITKQTRVTPAAPGTPTPILDAFLERIFRHDLDLVPYMHRVGGYSLTGRTTEHALMFCWGQGGNGKSVFFNTLAYVLGDYAVVAAPDLLLETKGDRHPTDMAMLMGARLVIASEVAPGRAWDEPKLKSLTGGDPITARFMRQDFFTYIPQFTLLVAGNHKPSFRSVDEAIRRRVQLVPFLQNIPRAERDPQLFEKLKEEAPAILRKLIEGCLEWQQQALNPPESVREASATYLDGEDVLGQWLAERCDRSNRWAETPFGELFADWKAWREVNGLSPQSGVAFSKALEERGFIKGKTTSGDRSFSGLTLIEKADENDAAENGSGQRWEGTL